MGRLRFRPMSGDLEIAPGEKLMVLRRMDGSGTSLAKSIAMDDLMRGLWKLKTSSQK